MIGTGVLVVLVALIVAVVYVVDGRKDDRRGRAGRHRRRRRHAARRRGRADPGAQAGRRDRREGCRRVPRQALRPAPESAKARVDVDATLDAALDAGAGETVTPRVAFSRAAVEAFAGRIAQRVDRKARDADIEWHDGKLERTRARPGLEVRQGRARRPARQRHGGPAPERRVVVPVKATERPDRTFVDLAKRYPTVIAVDRDAKRLRLYEHLQLDKRYKIAVGKAGLETAAGRYKIQEKIVNPDWHVPMSDWAGELAGRTIPPGDPQNPLEAR